jgi:hypothetical protein
MKAAGVLFAIAAACGGSPPPRPPVTTVCKVTWSSASDDCPPNVAALAGVRSLVGQTTQPAIVFDAGSDTVTWMPGNGVHLALNDAQGIGVYTGSVKQMVSIPAGGLGCTIVETVTVSLTSPETCTSEVTLIDHWEGVNCPKVVPTLFCSVAITGGESPN